ncbi:MAG: metallophosphoesterase [Acidobacteria bacterium]|nr:metallophosphoesterase [Acidobacteriota bacterium]
MYGRICYTEVHQTRYLIITDIHGNIDALNAIEEPVDNLLILGDLVDYGAAPEESVCWAHDRNATRIRMARCGLQTWRKNR